jgi:putative hydrolase
MSLLEGHAEHVMDGVGPGVVPTVAHIRDRFQQRRKETGGVLDKALRRLLGLDLKALQYAEGKAFVDHCVAEVGMERFNRVWESPETLPTREEIRDPLAWVRRVGGGPREITA